MISLEDKKKIQDQQRLDTAREILEKLATFSRNHNSLLVCIIINDFIKETSNEYLGHDLYIEDRG